MPNLNLTSSGRGAPGGRSLPRQVGANPDGRGAGGPASPPTSPPGSSPASPPGSSPAHGHAAHGCAVTAALAADRALIGTLCGFMERAADTLPDTFEPGAAVLIATAAPEIVGGHCRLHDEHVFPALTCRAGSSTLFARAAAHSAREHREALGQVIELAEALEEIGALGHAPHPERTGLLLRAMFESLTRHVGWESIIVSEGIDSLLGAEDRTLLGARIEAARLADPARWRREGLLID